MLLLIGKKVVDNERMVRLVLDGDSGCLWRRTSSCGRDERREDWDRK